VIYWGRVRRLKGGLMRLVRMKEGGLKVVRKILKAKLLEAERMNQSITESESEAEKMVTKVRYG